MSELRYDTPEELGDEIEAWFSNDEGLYLEARRIVRRAYWSIDEDSDGRDKREAETRACAGLRELAEMAWPSLPAEGLNGVKWCKMIESFE